MNRTRPDNGKAPQRDPSDISPPRTPPSQMSSYQTIRKGPQGRPSLQGAFSDDTTATDTTNSSNESGDEPDPHDLSLSPKHAARTSIVDNMLQSLDQFSAGTSVLDDYRLFHSVLESDFYNRDSPASSSRGRFRGHTFSSSLSSEPDLAYEEGVSHYGIQTANGRRSNSLRGTSSARGYDSLHSRTQPHAGSSSFASRTRQGSKGSSSSNYDFGPSLSRNRAESGSDAQSASIDYDVGTPFPPFPEDDYDTLRYDDLDAAPTPSIPAGPRKYHSPSQSEYQNALNPQSSMTPIASRRNSITSPSDQGKKKHRPENIGTATIRRPVDLELEPPPPLGDSLDPPAPSPTISYNKPSFPPPPDLNPPKERPGFFRRVFGSKNSASNAPDDVSYLPHHDNSDFPKVGRQPSKIDVPGTNTSVRSEGRQVVNKKSSFFRRRKKSVVDSVPPPISIPQHLAPKALDLMKPEPSPVSSLRQVMNPYISEGVPAPNRSSREYHGREISAEDADHAKSASLASQKKRGSSVPPSSGSRSKYPGAYPPVPSGGLDTSFLANSSGDEASTTKSVDIGVTSPLSSPVSKDTDSESLGSPTQGRLAPPLPQISVPGTTLSPVVEDFPQKTPETPEAPNPAKMLTPGTDSVPSETPNYYNAASTPVIRPEKPESAESPETKQDETVKDGEGSGPTTADREQAQKLFDSQDEVVGNDPAAAWLGDPGRAVIREAYMNLFDWSNMHILAGLRSLCNRLILKGETQQIDRVLDAFSTRWCRCNPSHGFKAADVVHTICYSLLLLNTDLHLADIDQKMTKTQFVRNTLPTIERVAIDAAPRDFENQASSSSGADGSSKLVNRLSRADLSGKTSMADFENGAGPLVNQPFHGTMRAWEQQVETVLREFYSSIQKERLPLHGAQPERDTPQASSNNLLCANQNPSLRRSPSTVSKSGSDIYPRGRSADSRYGTARWSSKPRSRAKLYPPSAMGSSRTSLDDQSSLWSPSASSTWSKYSLGKFTSVSVDSFGSDFPRGEYQQSIGFANALSQAIIREDGASIASTEDPDATPLLEDETLQLAGAPWAKEGSLKHKHHLDSVDKRAKDRNWNDCFAVIQQGWMRLFSFNPAKSGKQQKAKQRQAGSVVVGGGNWLSNAEEVWKFTLRQTIASQLPPPGYSKSRPHVWALSLPTGAVHLFQAGTPEIVREFVSTANYWSARLSKQPLVGGISNIEYGWSDAVINSALIHADSNSTNSPNHNTNGKSTPTGTRTSIQSSIRSSMDQQGVRPKLPADRVNISDWTPPQQSMAASNLPEEDQLKALKAYVKNTEEEFQRHNERRAAMILAFSPRHPNASKAMANFERKSSYLLREIVKFRTYIDSLHGALEQKKRIYPPNEENEDNKENIPTADDDSKAGDGQETPTKVSIETAQPA